MTTTVNSSGLSEGALTRWVANVPQWAILAFGAAISMFAVGGRWDIALAAWIAPVFLLRFSRTSTPLKAIGVIWLICIVNVAWSTLQLSSGGSLAGPLVYGAAIGTILCFPYIVDRLFAVRLGLVARLLVFPACLATAEFLVASFSPVGFVTGARAATQADNLPLLQVMSLTGPYSIGFLIAWFATTANLVWEEGSLQKVMRPLLIFAAVLLAIISLGMARIAFAPTPSDYVDVAGITPSRAVKEDIRQVFGANMPGSLEAVQAADQDKLLAAYDILLDDLIDGTHEAAKAGAQIVIWSENAASATPESRNAVLERAAAVAREEGIYLNIGLSEAYSRNQTFLFNPDGKIEWHYMKNHPVFLMEPTPAGDTPVPVTSTPFGRLSNVICFDADFPTLTRVSADIMLVPGADWPQIGRVHTLNMARLRAIENGYALVRIASNSQSAAFDRYGRILATQDTTSPERHIMYAQVSSKNGGTLYNVIGDVFAWICLLGVAAAIGLVIFPRTKSPSHV